LSLRLYNTLSGKVEEFSPSEDNTVRMYACGPTVYDYGHIGNFRTFVAIDLLRRFLRQSGYKLHHVMNITDVEDKIIRNAAREHKSSSGSWSRKVLPIALRTARTTSALPSFPSTASSRKRISPGWRSVRAWT
jgi:cysteinyl-tRNA synthetase